MIYHGNFRLHCILLNRFKGFLNITTAQDYPISLVSFSGATHKRHNFFFDNIAPALLLALHQTVSLATLLS